MYESPITRIVGDIAANIVKREEDYLMESVRKVGFGIDKEELVKALRYDRDQYEKGFKDGRLSAEPKWIPCSERLPMINTIALITTSKGVVVQVMYFGENMNGHKVWRSFGGEYVYWDEEAVAWMPMPEPWKGEYDV